MEFHGTANGSTQLTYPPAIAELRRTFLESVKPGTLLKETITRFYPKASNQQKSMIWALLIGEFKRALDERGIDMATLFPLAQLPPGLPCPPKVLMEWLYAAYAKIGPDGKMVTLGRMNVEEAATFFEECRNYLATTWHIQVPDPDKEWRTKQTKGSPEPTTE